MRDIEKAWEIYYGVFTRIKKQLETLMTLDLQFVSPELLGARNLQLAVPGTYQAGGPIVTISSFVPKLTVISSKQRPRRLAIKGSDHKDYHFLLKGMQSNRTQIGRF